KATLIISLCIFSKSPLIIASSMASSKNFLLIIGLLRSMFSSLMVFSILVSWLILFFGFRINENISTRKMPHASFPVLLRIFKAELSAEVIDGQLAPVYGVIAMDHCHAVFVVHNAIDLVPVDLSEGDVCSGHHAFPDRSDSSMGSGSLKLISRPKASRRIWAAE